MYQQMELKPRESQSPKNDQKIKNTSTVPVKNVLNTPLMQSNTDLKIKKRDFNYSTSCVQPKYFSSNAIQREPMLLEDFQQRYDQLYTSYFNAAAQNKIWRFTSHPEETIGYAQDPGDVCDQVMGSTKTNKPLSFLHNINAILATTLSGKGDSNILTYINNSTKLCSIELSTSSALAEMGFGIWVAAANALTLMETECVLGKIKPLSKEAPSNLIELSKMVHGILIIDNPFKGKIIDGKLNDDTYDDKDCALTGLNKENIDKYSKNLAKLPNKLSHFIGTERTFLN